MKMYIARIRPPKYRVGRYVLNEYELRKLMVEVCEGSKQPGIKVKDEFGNIATIRADGRLDCSLSGLDINSKFTIALFRDQRTKRTHY